MLYFLLRYAFLHLYTYKSTCHGKNAERICSCKKVLTMSLSIERVYGLFGAGNAGGACVAVDPG